MGRHLRPLPAGRPWLRLRHGLLRRLKQTYIIGVVRSCERTRAVALDLTIIACTYLAGRPTSEVQPKPKAELRLWSRLQLVKCLRLTPWRCHCLRLQVFLLLFQEAQLHLLDHAFVPCSG